VPVFELAFFCLRDLLAPYTEIVQEDFHMDDFDFDTSLWDEIQDMPGEIFDIDGYIEEMSKTEDFPVEMEAF